MARSHSLKSEARGLLEKETVHAFAVDSEVVQSKILS